MKTKIWLPAVDGLSVHQTGTSAPGWPDIDLPTREATGYATDEVLTLTFWKSRDTKINLLQANFSCPINVFTFDQGAKLKV